MNEAGPASAGSSSARSAHEHRLVAILLLCAGVSFFGIMDGLGKLLGPDHSLAQIVWARYAFAVPVVLAATRPAGWRRLLACGRPWLQAARGTLPMLASLTVILGVRAMPLADATAITFITPLLVILFSALLLHERVGADSAIGVLMGFAGVLVIARPGTGTIAWSAAFPLATAVFAALYQVLTRLVSDTDDPRTTLAWTVFTGLVLTTPMAIVTWRPAEVDGFIAMILSGLTFGAGQWLVIRAFAHAPATVLAPFNYTQIVAAILFGILVFGDLPDRWTLVGTALVVLAGAYVLRRQH